MEPMGCLVGGEMVSCLWPRTQVVAAAPKSAPAMSAGVTTVPVSVFSDGNSLPLTRFATQQSHTSAWSALHKN